MTGRAPEWAPGHIVAGKYTVQAVLGRGERVRTYAALTEPNREVVLRAVGVEDASELDRVAQHAEALALLSEAQVLRVFEVVRDDDSASPSRFVVTERSRHPSLASLVELCPLTFEEGIAFAAKLGGAVDALHGKGVNHLGLRPSNVFVGAMPVGAVEIADACAPRLDEAASERLRWAPPETGDSGAADVFTVALLVFYALTGKSYWKGESGADLVAEVAGPREAASKRASVLGVTLPPSVDAAFERALASDPHARPKTAGELARMLGETKSASKSGSADVIAPPTDLMANLIEAELHNAHVDVKPLDKPDKAAVPLVADAAVLLSDVPAPLPLAPASPMPGMVLGPPALTSASAVEEPLPLAPKRRVGLVVGVVGAALVLLIAAGAVALVRKGSTAQPSASASSGSASARATTSVAASPTDTASVASTSSAVVGTATSTAPPPPAVLGPQESELLVVCEPAACDLVMIDRKRMTSYPDPTKLGPGQHGVGVSSHDYWGDWKLVETKGGERATVTFKLRNKADPLPNYVPHPHPTTAPIPTGTKKPCGKFLKRCD